MYSRADGLLRATSDLHLAYCLRQQLRACVGLIGKLQFVVVNWFQMVAWTRRNLAMYSTLGMVSAQIFYVNNRLHCYADIFLDFLSILRNSKEKPSAFANFSA